MTSHSFEIRHGKLIDVIGSPVRFEDVTFVPASIELSGTSFSAEFNLLDWAGNRQQKLPLIVRDDENAAWCLGRLIYLFNTENVAEDERMEKTCFNVSFIAVLHDLANVSVPFECSDHYGRTSLVFSSEDQPSLEIRTQIANSFYGLLLDDAESLTDYGNRMYHGGGGFWIDFGVSHGEPYFDEQHERDC